MPMKKKFIPKKGGYRKKGNRAYKAKITKGVSTNLHLFPRWTNITTMTLVSTANSVGSISRASNGYLACTTAAAPATPAYYSVGMGFCLADIIDYTDFTNLFDRWKICGVKVRILPVNTGSENISESGAASYLTNGGFIHSAIDKDDLTPAAATENGVMILRQYPSYKVNNLATKKIDRYLRPKLSGVAWATGAATQGAVMPSTYLDCNQVNFNHFGFKFIIEIVQQGGIAVTHYFKVEAKYYLALRDPR